MTSCLFITSQYPLNRGDAAFIKNEIIFTSKKFDKIYIMCLDKVNTDNDLLPVPENIIVDFFNPQLSKIKKMWYLVTNGGIPALASEIIDLIKKRKLSIQSLYTAIAFLANAFLLRYRIKHILSQDKNIALIYTYWYYYPTMAALLATQRMGIKCVTRTHGFDLYEFRSTQHYQPYKSWMDKRIDKVFFISKHGYDYYLNTFAECDFKKYSLSYLGIFNNYSLNQKRQIQNRFVLLSCSYIVPVKRIHLIVKSLAEINDCSIHWIHIGDGVERDTIIFLAHDLLHDKKNISYEFKGFMTNDEVMQFYSEHYFDCFISTSESEGLPVSMMEAISFGIPIIATNVGGVSELVNKDTGILLDPNGDILAIKKAIVDFYNFSEDTKMAIRKAARRLWEAKFNAEVNYAGFSDDLLRISQKG